MIVDLMHACDVAEALAADPPAALEDWQWARQLRFYSEVRQQLTLARLWQCNLVACCNTILINS
jgi:hypothetical protein